MDVAFTGDSHCSYAAAVPVPIRDAQWGVLGGLRAVVASTQALAEHGEAGALAVVIETDGSTYRKPGALVVLDTRGARVGALSGGFDTLPNLGPIKVSSLELTSQHGLRNRFAPASCAYVLRVRCQAAGLSPTWREKTLVR